jgi:hypothetical protein
MNKKLTLEFGPLSIFLICCLLSVFKVPYSHLLALLTGFLIASLYFYAAFWLFAETGTPVLVRIIAGVTFSIAIVSSLFSLLHWPMWKLYDIIGCVGLGITAILCLINFKSSGYKALLYRCLLFIAVLLSIYSYRSVIG